MGVADRCGTRRGRWARSWRCRSAGSARSSSRSRRSPSPSSLTCSSSPTSRSVTGRAGGSSGRRRSTCPCSTSVADLFINGRAGRGSTSRSRSSRCCCCSCSSACVHARRSTRCSLGDRVERCSPCAAPRSRRGPSASRRRSRRSRSSPCPRRSPGSAASLYGVVNFAISKSTVPPLLGLVWIAIAVTFGIRRPGGALLAGLAFACSQQIFEWIGSDVPRWHRRRSSTASQYFTPILFGLGAINLAKNPDGVLALVGHERLEKRRAKQREAVIAAAEAELHGGHVPEHERIRRRPRDRRHATRRRRGRGALARAGSSPATARSRCCTASTSTSPRAESWRCSARTAPASRRCARSPRARSRPTLGSRAARRGSTSPRTPRTDGSVTACCSSPKRGGSSPGSASRRTSRSC